MLHTDKVLGPMETLDKMIIILFTGSIWTGERTMKKSELNLAVDALPPEAISRLGSKHVFNTEKLKVFHTLKARAERLCLEVGIRFLGGFAVPYEEAVKLAPNLNDIESEFNTERDSLLRFYDHDLNQFVASYPEWETMLRNASLTKAEVQGRLSFEWVPTKIGSPDIIPGSDADAVMSKSLESKAKGLAGQLYLEIAKAALDIEERSLKDRPSVDQRFVRSFERIKTKLTALSFLDVRIQPLIATIDHVTAGLPSAGTIEGIGLAALQGLLFILTDESRMQKHADRIRNGSTVASAFTSSAPVYRQAKADDRQREAAAKSAAAAQQQANEVAALAEAPTKASVASMTGNGDSDLFGGLPEPTAIVVVNMPAPVATAEPATRASVVVKTDIPQVSRVGLPLVTKPPKANINFGAFHALKQ